MPWLEVWFPEEIPLVPIGGLFLESDPANSLLSSISCKTRSNSIVRSISYRKSGFLSVSLSVRGDNGYVSSSVGLIECNGDKSSSENMEMVVETERDKEEKIKGKIRSRGASAGAVNTTKHLWSGAFAAMVSRYVTVSFTFFSQNYKNPLFSNAKFRVSQC
jgi:hypothetical protein